MSKFIGDKNSTFMETQEIIQLSDLDLSKTYTYADYLQWKFKERTELIKGRIFKMSPAPSSVHQRISRKILVALYNFMQGKPCEVFNAPLMYVSLKNQKITGMYKQLYNLIFV